MAGESKEENGRARMVAEGKSKEDGKSKDGRLESRGGR